MKTKRETKIIYALSVALLMTILFIVFFIGHQWLWKPAEQRAMVRGANVAVNNLFVQMRQQIDQNDEIVIAIPQWNIILIEKPLQKGK